MPSNIQAILYGFAGFSAFAIADSFLKLSMQEGLPPIHAAFWNDIFALIVVFVLIIKTVKIRDILQLPSRKWHILRSIFFTITFLCALSALKNIPVTDYYALVFSAPLITALMAALFLKEPMKNYHYLSLLGGLIGVLIILRPGFTDINTSFLIALAGAVFFSLGNICNRYIDSNDPIAAYAFYPTIITLIATAILINIHITLPPLETLIYLCLAGILSTSGVILIGIAFSLAHATTIAPIHYSQMIWGVVLGYFIFGDILQPWVALGACFVIISGFILIHGEKKERERNKAG